MQKSSPSSKKQKSKTRKKKNSSSNSNNNMFLSMSLPDKFPPSSSSSNPSSRKKVNKTSINIEKQSKIYYAGAAFDRSPAPSTLPKPHYYKTDDNLHDINVTSSSSDDTSNDEDDDNDSIDSSPLKRSLSQKSLFSFRRPESSLNNFDNVEMKSNSSNKSLTNAFRHSPSSFASPPSPSSLPLSAIPRLLNASFSRNEEKGKEKDLISLSIDETILKNNIKINRTNDKVKEMSRRRRRESTNNNDNNDNSTRIKTVNEGLDQKSVKLKQMLGIRSESTSVDHTTLSTLFTAATANSSSPVPSCSSLSSFSTSTRELKQILGIRHQQHNHNNHNHHSQDKERNLFLVEKRQLSQQTISRDLPLSIMDTISPVSISKTKNSRHGTNNRDRDYRHPTPSTNVIINGNVSNDSDDNDKSDDNDNNDTTKDLSEISLQIKRSLNIT